MPDPKELKDKLGFEPIDPPSKAQGATKTKTSSAKKKRQRPTDLTITQIEKALEAQIELIGILVSGLDSYDGQIITEKAPELAEALTELARTNAGVRAFLERLIATGAWSGVIAIMVGEIALPIAVHHGKLPEPINSFMAEIKDIPVKESKNGTKENTDEKGNPEKGDPLQNLNEGRRASQS